MDEKTPQGAVPAYLLDREGQSQAKVLSNMIKQKRKEKAGKWEVPLPKVRAQGETEVLKVIRTGKRKKKLVKCSMRIRLFLNTFPLHLQPAQNPHPPHPGYLLRHSSIGCTLSLTYAHMPALQAGQGVFPASSSRMDSHRLADDQPIFDQLPDLLTRVGIGDFISLIGVQPDLLFATAEDTRGR
uniref:Uncharacterized protein n=1 Tax=Prolemur simus TaxID=1328070 RepID=A0A8C8Z1C9_PROSS